MIYYALKIISFCLFCLLGITASAFASYPFTNDTSTVSIDSSMFSNDTLKQVPIHIFYGQIINRIDDNTIRSMNDEELSQWKKSKESLKFCQVSNSFLFELENKWKVLTSINTTKENEFQISLLTHNLKINQYNNQSYKTIVLKVRVLQILDSQENWVSAPSDSILSIYIFENDGIVYNLPNNQLVRLHAVPEIDSLPRPHSSGQNVSFSHQ